MINIEITTEHVFFFFFYQSQNKWFILLLNSEANIIMTNLNSTPFRDCPLL